MGLAPRTCAVGACFAVAWACGLGVGGLGPSDAGDDAATPADVAPSSDHAPPPDAGAGEARPGDGGGGEGSPDSGCPGVEVVDDFSTLDAATWIAVGAAAVVQPGEVTLVPAGSPYDAGALWLRTPETFEDFDVSFRARVDHVSNAAPPSDGFTFAWLHDAMGNAAPGDSSADRALGVPSGFAGYGVEYDTYRMMTGYLHVDPTRGVPGQYPWEVPGTLQSMSFVMNTWHDVTVRLRAGALTASVDGVPWSASAPGFQPFAGYMGFTAHSGYAGDGFDLSQFHASFEQPGCDP